MKLSITIPAYNEETAIASIIERCLASRGRLTADTDLDEVDIVVVSDGSTDRTAEIAQTYISDDQVRLIAYTPNRGYGAALKRGFRESNGELVGFLDADGTCNPEFFVPLVNACLRDGADIACGCRMTATSKMPAVRRLGNRIFRAIINFLAKTSIRDSASGMRVIRRDALSRIYPLPDGLHFTPAMSCRAAMDPALTLVEVDMHYEDRVGESKLRVIRDGMRFLQVILDTALSYRPLRIFGTLAAVLLLLAFVLGSGIAYVKFIDPGYAHLPKWYLFRMMTALAAASAGLTLVMVGVVAERVAVLVQRQQPASGFLTRVLRSGTTSGGLLILGVLAVAAGAVLNLGTLKEWLRTGQIELNNWWAYVITGGFLVVAGAQLIAIALLDRVILLLKAHRTYINETLSDDLGNEEFGA